MHISVPFPSVFKLCLQPGSTCTKTGKAYRLVSPQSQWYISDSLTSEISPTFNFSEVFALQSNAISRATEGEH